MIYNLTAYTDGSYFKNNGGNASIVLHGSNFLLILERETSSYVTNNRMELKAVINILKHLNSQCNITIYCDSKYVVDSIDQGWVNNWVNNNWRNSGGDVKNRDLWEEYLMYSQYHNVKMIWVRGHNGNIDNEFVDEMANYARKYL
jgi:ribonuclease HI